MSTESGQEVLKNFFSAYFNQDWHCDAESTEQVVAEYASLASAPQAKALAEAILNYSTRFASDQELENGLYRELGCYYLPSGDGLSAKDWLKNVASQLLMDKSAPID
jgi:hypothetical protein